MQTISMAEKLLHSRKRRGTIYHQRMMLFILHRDHRDSERYSLAKARRAQRLRTTEELFHTSP